MALDRPKMKSLRVAIKESQKPRNHKQNKIKTKMTKNSKNARREIRMKKELLVRILAFKSFLM